jgi:hypothetical protein
LTRRRQEKDAMKTPEPITDNADLWAKFFRDQWGASSGSPAAQIAEGTAARVSNFVNFLAAGPIALLYGSNAPSVRPVSAAEREAAEVAAHAEDVLDSLEDHAA